MHQGQDGKIYPDIIGSLPFQIQHILEETAQKPNPPLRLVFPYEEENTFLQHLAVMGDPAYVPRIQYWRYRLHNTPSGYAYFLE